MPIVPIFSRARRTRTRVWASAFSRTWDHSEPVRRRRGLASRAGPAEAARAPPPSSRIRQFEVTIDQPTMNQDEVEGAGWWVKHEGAQDHHHDTANHPPARPNRPLLWRPFVVAGHLDQ